MVGGWIRRGVAACVAHPCGMAATLFALALIPILSTPVLPLIDFTNHLARFYVLAHHDSSALLQNNYEVHWSLIPDIAGDLLGMPLLRILPPLIAGHLIVIGTLAVLYGGVLYLNHALTGRVSILVAALALPLLYSYILNWGFINFLLGLGFAFWGAAWWLRNRRFVRFAVPVSCGFAILIFFAHGVAFALYGIMLVGFEAGIFLGKDRRRIGQFIHRLALVAVQAVMPVLFFLYWRLVAVAVKGPHLAATHATPGASVPAGHFSLYRLGTILRVEESPAYWFDAATLLLQIAILGGLVWQGRVRVAVIARPLLVAAGLLILIMPSMMFGAWYISDRIPLFAALLLVATLSRPPGRTARRESIAYGVLGAVIVARLSFIAVDWHGYGDRFREFQSVASAIAPGSRVAGIAIGGGHHDTHAPRCEMYLPLLIALNGQVGPIFSDKSLHPLALAGGLKSVDARLHQLAPVPPDENTRDFNSYITAAFAAGYDYVLACNVQIPARAFPARFPVDARTAHFALIGAAP